MPLTSPGYTGSQFLYTSKHSFSKGSKILYTFYFLFSKKMWVIRAGIHKILVRIANREDPDQTASIEAVGSGSVLFI